MAVTPEIRLGPIVVVDDNGAMRYATSRVFRQAGYSVVEAANGQEALECVRQLPDLVVLDINLPDIDGREVCRRIKTDPATASVPVLHLTASYLTPADRVAALEGGADGYLTHPVDPPDLLATAKALVRMKHAEQRARRAEDELRTLNAELEERVARRTEQLEARTLEVESFSYSASHDLRAPLRAIDGFSALLAASLGESLDEEQRRLLRVIRTNTRKMGDLIDALLAFSRAGRQQLTKTPVDSEAMVRSVLEELVGPHGRPGLEVRVGPLPGAFADVALLRQVWVNLLSNAVKFSATKEHALVEVRGREEGKDVLYEVADNGVGFDERYTGKLFGVFQRLHGPEFEGTGIGLALVQAIVTRLGGAVRAASGPSGGATFTFTLPFLAGPVRPEAMIAAVAVVAESSPQEPTGSPVAGGGERR